MMTLRRHLFAYGLRAIVLATGLALGMASVSGCPEQSNGPTPAPEAARAPESDFATTGTAPVAASALDADTGGALDAAGAPGAADSTTNDVPEAMDGMSSNGR